MMIDFLQRESSFFPFLMNDDLFMRIDTGRYIFNSHFFFPSMIGWLFYI